ncbi:MAG: DNA alkylation repair protein, partial [Polyangiaceae bacterium]|nr:DNA alkylation repair protein [Polyangiaceae bacterium]
MAGQLKDFFSQSLVESLAHSIKGAHPRFEHTAFVKDATKGLARLELMARGAHIAAALRKHLPPGYPEAVDILLRSIGTAKAPIESSMAPFFYLPHTMLIATHGLDDFETSMRAQHKLTQVFTCEFSIRPFLEKYPDKTLEVLARWSKDRNENVRRLVSEGTRPRLPWATRVRWIEREPERAIPLLETLKDDPS